MDSDYQYALLLQKQLAHEESFSPVKNYPVSNKKNVQRSNKTGESTSSLIDPSWELVDPTPNIFNLFTQFDKRYFWSKLTTVIVKWSKRMTTCAGVCSYEGRGGACTVSLSEPLLKLRPRKDLIETLLHEMIHAFLFVTHNNRDRDGHGPEFHKHMYRINSEAGTKISVYHDFHDEVRLYKTHWWRCNGPCQHRKPFFGMVKRAANRKPGPNDRWWAQHQAQCNGTFIKIREPDSKRKKGELATKSVPVTDIRKYIQTGTKSDGKPSYMQPGGVAQIKTIKDVDAGPSKFSGGLMNKGGGTLVLNPKTGKAAEKDPNPLRIDTFKAFSGTGRSLLSSGSSATTSGSSATTSISASTSSAVSDSGGDCVFNDTANIKETVRNVWANKFTETNKRPLSVPEESNKKVKHEERHQSTSEQGIVDLTQNANCPICCKSIVEEDMNSHLDQCLENSFNGEFEDLEDANGEESGKMINCLVCNKLVNDTQLNMHLETCMTDVFEEDMTGEVVQIDGEKMVQCPCCPTMVLESAINIHLDECMSS